MLEINYKALGIKKAMQTVAQIPPKLQLRTLAVGRRTAMASLTYHSPGGMGSRDAWSSKFDKGKGSVEFFNTKYPLKIVHFMEGGTKPHPIPKPPPMPPGRSLRFMVGGKVVFAKSVEHPGTKPYKMIEHAARDSALAMRDAARRYMPGVK